MPNIRSSAVRGQKVTLQIQLYDAEGNAVDAEKSPSIRIRNPDGDTVLDYTNRKVLRVSEGLYKFDYTVEDDSEIGIWIDDWRAEIDNAIFETSFTFDVVDTDALTADEGPAKIKIADDVVFDFSDQEIYGINVLLKFLKARLRSSGRKPVRDQFGAFVYDAYGEYVTEPCDIFDDEVLVCLLCQSLSEFNSVPHFTRYAFSDDLVYNLFSQVIVEGAYVFALASQSLLEKGRDFTISDGGVSYQPPQLGEFLQSQYGTWLSSHRENIKFIKNSIKPGPRGFGTYTNISSGAPAFSRLRHLRSRRIL
jgi:hypothetical protein